MGAKVMRVHEPAIYAVEIEVVIPATSGDPTVVEMVDRSWVFRVQCGCGYLSMPMSLAEATADAAIHRDCSRGYRPLG
jgi:hypothetical protein